MHKPEQVTLVPDDPAQATSDHGWDFQSSHNMLAPLVSRIKDAGMRVSLFCDPDSDQMDWAAKTGCDRVELYTGPYGATHSDEKNCAIELEKLGAAADAAIELGFAVNAGHDLTVDNLPALVRRVPALAEVSVGHGFTADALLYGLEASVKRFISAVTV